MTKRGARKALRMTAEERSEMMKTEELYYKDVHRTEFTAEVLSCTADKKNGTFLAVLDRTAFFPEQGGQKSDRGTLGEAEVLDAHVKGGIITHVLDRPLEEGSTVTGKVDWARRFDFMQQHTGEHMLSGRVHARFGYDNVGFHLSETETTLDFSGPIDAEALKELELEVNRAIWADIPVKTGFPEEEVLKNLDYRSKLELTHDVRIVEIPGIDVCACCAPHCDTTAQVGIMKITDVMNYKGGVRLHIACGQRALSDYGRKQDAVDAVSVLLSAKREEIAEAVKKHLEKESRTEVALAETGRKLLEAYAAALPSPEESRHALLFVESADQNTMRRTMNGLAERYEGISGVFCGSDADGYRFVLGSRNIDCKALAAELRKAGFKCGGSDIFLQGSTGCTAEAIRQELLRR